MWKSVLRYREGGQITLPDGATIVVAGGGPAGSVFAIQTLREARRRGKKVQLILLEQKKELRFNQPHCTSAAREGCNYCAGGISPRLAAALKSDGLSIPDEIVAARAESLTIHGDWKSIELPIPEGREMMCVFRGSRPRQRENRHQSLDSYLVEKAVEEGATLLTAEACAIRYSVGGKPAVFIRTSNGPEETLQADFAVFATGVNQIPGKDPRSCRLSNSLKQLLPGFCAPKVRQTLICELHAEPELIRHMRGEVHFALHGARDLAIEMSSLIPKDRWITVVLLGRSVDRADRSQYLQIMKRFLSVPHIRRLIPRQAILAPVCMCSPSMTVGAARNPFGDRVALIGDIAVSRLYKDGIYSAYVTASALSKCILTIGIDRRSLRKGYWGVVRRFRNDNIFGRVVFFFNRVAFSHPMLSRIFYQAVMTERKTKPKQKRRLGSILWRTASGDDSYRSILTSMMHPANAWSILVGALVTLRNTLTERILGLSWTGLGRYPTGVAKEDVERHRREVRQASGSLFLERLPEFERMYRIKIKGDPSRVHKALGEFGDDGRDYFSARLIGVNRVAGRANEIGSIIRYEVFRGWFSFGIVLEKALGTRLLLYRVLDGFARGGVLAFEIYKNEDGVSVLSIYVAFDFAAGRRPSARLGWSLCKLFFPAFVHDVVWNHALCEIKHTIEIGPRGPGGEGSSLPRSIW